MSRVRLAALPLLAVLLAAGLPVWGQAGLSEASGEVVDAAGNPVVGATVKFTPAGNPSLSYTGKTNKKGRYFIPGLFTPQERDTWIVEVTYEGFELVEATIETRNVNKVLNIPGDKFTAKNGQISGFGIPKLGTAKVDLKLASAADVAAERAAKVAAGVSAEAVVEVVRDPWAEATTLAGAGQYEESLPLFAEAVAADPAASERRETYAKVLAHLERYDEALAQLDASAEAAPERVETSLLIAQIKMRQGDHAAAKELLGTVAERVPDDVRVYQATAELAAEAGDVSGQLAAWEAITRLKADDAEAWVALGDLYAKAGRLKDSEAAYQKVVDLDPDNAYRTYYNLAVFNLTRDNATEQDRKRAIEALRRAVQIKPDFAQAYKQLGLALIGTGDTPGAKQALEKYLSLKPDAPDSAQMKAIVATL